MAPLALALCACGSQHAAAPSGASPRVIVPRRSSARHERGTGASSASVPAVPGARESPVAARPFAILRRPARSGDRLPPLALEAVLHNNAAHATGGAAVSAATARRAPLAGGLPSWVLAAPGYTCLLRAQPLGRGHAYAYSMSCVRTSWARRGLLVSVFANVAQDPGQSILEGVLPDRASNVVVTDGDGTRHAARLRQNTYSLLTTMPRSVTFEIGRARHTVPLPQPPEAPLVQP